MTNVEYIIYFSKKHKFPKSECEVVFNIPDDGVTAEIYANDDDIISVKFDKSIVENEISIEDIRFDVDSDFPEDVFFMWQKDNPKISFKNWIAMGRYTPTIINGEFLNELDNLTKEIEMKFESMFTSMETNDSSYDFDDDSEEYEDGEDD